MLSIFDGLREVTLASVMVRLFLAVLCGGLIGLEREYIRRRAGFRTHILICLGAAMTTMTSQYLYLNLHFYTDMTRMGAQVVAGIGFIGAGTIIVTGRQRVKGLTTAAGLWAAAIAGLALGGGFYEGGLCVTVFVLAAELVFSRLEYWLLEKSPEINLYLEYSSRETIDRVLDLCRERGVKALHMEIARHTSGDKHNACAIFTLRLHKKCKIEMLLPVVAAADGVVSVKEL